MYLFQYWDQEPIPGDVASWINGCRAQNPGLDHILLDHDKADALIAEHFTRKERIAFASCGPPAMQADYLRLCLMYALGGLYLDADQAPLEELSQLIDKADGGLLVQWHAILNNGPLLLRKPGNLYIKACLDLATENIIERRFQDVLMTTGPGVMNAVWCLIDREAEIAIEFSVAPAWRPGGWDALLRAARGSIPPTPELSKDFHDLTRITTDECMRWLGLTNPAYKSGDRHWPNWPGSIYSAAALADVAR